VSIKPPSAALQKSSKEKEINIDFFSQYAIVALAQNHSNAWFDASAPKMPGSAIVWRLRLTAVRNRLRNIVPNPRPGAYLSGSKIPRVRDGPGGIRSGRASHRQGAFW
jgi:hypothetical protein